MYVAASRPDAPEHHEYADTAAANAAGPMPKVCMIWGPSGIITMKSMMMVNWVSASSHSRRRSCWGARVGMGQVSNRKRVASRGGS